ncbi:MAG: DUF4166 domain-containing protein [Planctomycetota bacterium]
MSSIYQRALGGDFEKLHPMIQKRFGLSSAGGTASIGRGLMEELWIGPWYTRPFLLLGTWRRIMFPESGRDIPFTIENYAYRDSFDRETVTWVRTFEMPKKRRRFDATMIYSERREQIVDYLGSHQHLAVDIEMSVAENGGVQLRSGSQRFYEGIIGFPFPMFFSGVADVCEWYDDDACRYRISVDVRNPVWGKLFGYRGSFEAEFFACKPSDVPIQVKPVREERRE